MTAPGGATETGHIVAYLSLDDTEWSRSIARAKRDLAELARTDVDIAVRVNVDQANRAITDLERRIDRLGRAGGTGKIRLDDSDAKARLDQVRRSLGSLDGRGAIRLDNSGSQAEIERVRAALASLADADVNVRVDAGDAIAKLTELRTLLTRIAALQDLAIRVRVDDSGALAQLAAIRLELMGLREDADTDIEFRSNARQTAADIGGIGQGADRSRSQVRLLMDTILLLGSAAVPVAGVAGGALVGLLPTLAATAFGIAGIRDMVKSGAIETTEYAGDISTLKGELVTLKAVTAAGLLDGLHDALADSAPLFGVVNTDAHQMSQQLGQIASNGLPGVLTVLTQLNPLFQTFGSELVRGADGFTRWAQSSDGVSEFVSYVQSELPAVEHTLGSLLRLIAHLGEGLGPVGHLTLMSIGVLADAINSLPVGVLQTLLPLIIATRMAMLGYRGIGAVMTGVQAAYTRTAGTAQAMGVSVGLAHLQSAEAAAVDAAATDAANVTRIESELAAMRASQTASAGIIAAKERELIVARATALGSAAAAEGSAERTAAAGAVAATGWKAALGPIAGLILILGTLGLSMGSSEDDANAAAEAQQNYAESVKQSVDIMNRANVQATIKTLSDGKAFQDLKRITTGTNEFNTTQGELIGVINGKSAPAFDAYIARLQKYRDETERAGQSIGDNAKYTDAEKTQMYEQVKATDLLITKTKAARDTLLDKLSAQRLELAAQRSAAEIYAGGGTAAAEQAAALGLQRDAYLDAVAAGLKNADQVKQQTAAYQAANDAASLFKQTLDLLNSRNLDTAEAQTAVASANLRTAQAFEKNGNAIKGNSEAALSNQQNVQQAVQSAQNYVDVLGKQKDANGEFIHSSADLAAAYAGQKRALEDQLRSVGALTPAVQKYIDKLFALGDVAPKPVPLDADPSAAEAKVKAIQARIDAIKQGKVPGVDADSRPGEAQVAALQQVLNALKQGRVPVVDADTAEALRKLGIVNGYQLADKTVVVKMNIQKKANDPRMRSKGGPVTRATGGPVIGPGTGTSDSVAAMMFVNGRPVQPYALSNGEWIMNTAATTKNKSALQAANNGALLGVVHRAAGGEITKHGKGKKATWTYGATEYSSKRAAQNAQRRAITQNIKIAAEIDGRGLAEFRKALLGTADQAAAAFRKVADRMKDVGASDGLLRSLRRANAALDRTLAHRDKLRARLGTPSRSNSTAYERLEQIRTDRAQLAGSVRDTARGAFDLTGAGRVESEDGRVTSNFHATQAAGIQSANLIERFFTGIKKLASGVLGKSKTGRAMLQKLVGDGPEAAYPLVASLLKQTPKDITALVGTQARVDQASARLGAWAGTQMYGAAETKAVQDVKALRAQIAADDRRAKAQGAVIASAVRAGLHDLHLEVHMDGKKVSKGVRKGNKKNDRRHGRH